MSLVRIPKMEDFHTTEDIVRILMEEDRKSDIFNGYHTYELADALKVPRHLINEKYKLSKNRIPEDALRYILTHWAAREGEKATYSSLRDHLTRFAVNKEFSLRIERLETKEWDKSSELSRRTLSPHDTEMDTDTQNIINADDIRSPRLRLYALASVRVVALAAAVGVVCTIFHPGVILELSAMLGTIVILTTAFIRTLRRPTHKMDGPSTAEDIVRILMEEDRKSDIFNGYHTYELADALKVPRHLINDKYTLSKNRIPVDALRDILIHWVAREGERANYGSLRNHLTRFAATKEIDVHHSLEAERSELVRIPILPREKDERFKRMSIPFGLHTNMQMIEETWREIITWKQVFGLGRAFWKINEKLIISEEILAIMPTTVVIFFSPPRTTTSTEEDYRTLENASLSEIQNSIRQSFPHLITTKLDILRQLIVYDMDFDILKLLADSTVTCNFVVDNPQQIAKGSIHTNTDYGCKLDLKTSSSNTDEYFQRFAQLHSKARFGTSWYNVVKNWLQGALGLAQENRRTIKVAMLDTGVGLDDLPNKRCFTLMRNAMVASPALVKCSDDSTNSHGTKVGYVLSRSCHPSTEILPIKVLDSNTGGNYDAIALGLQYARKDKADIVNCSFNRMYGDGCEQVVSENAFLEEFKISNVLPIVSAGNGDNSSALLPPADLNCVISVGSVTWEGSWSQSSCGKCLASIATFGEYLAIRRNDSVSFEEGTSLAAPAVSGLLTHLISINPTVKDVETTKKILIGTADPVKGCDQGHSPCKKHLNVSRAYQAAKNLSSGISVPPPADAHILVDLRAVLQDLHNA
ncbi:uncharacterized protein LOC118437230 isoform X2 [Folsomia candida]|uniref:uncharacterized protein LOC118437230 isoform X2 n=1 Tax=Folsomia candida TaxID=158441 RepID=UPI001604F5F2|nr:uncharacterized protein LOC118437230 isoform X2 [Folsomia candida]